MAVGTNADEVRQHRAAVASNLRDKIAEVGFFVDEIVRASDAIERKHLTQDYPINAEVTKLNSLFGALLNSFQSVKDACQTALGIKIKWNELSPEFGRFIYYCRTATTHDGSHMINAGLGTRCFIAGPLFRIDSDGNLQKFNPPPIDVLTLSLAITKDVLSAVKVLLETKAELIPKPRAIDPASVVEAALQLQLIPEQVKAMIRENRRTIADSIGAARHDRPSASEAAITEIDRLLARLG